jgi:hypothetical protein
MTYKQAIEATFSREEVAREIRNHGLAFYDFVRDCGYREQYEGVIVLNWLGY